MIKSLFRSIWSTEFSRYVVFGSIVLCVDIGGLTLLLRLGIIREIAVTTSFICAMIVQFSLNRWFNFRRFDRGITSQMAGYLLITSGTLVITLATVDFMVLALHTSALVGKAASLGLTLPASYFGHKHITFGDGLRATLRRLFPSAD